MNICCVMQAKIYVLPRAVVDSLYKKRISQNVAALVGGIEGENIV